MAQYNVPDPEKLIACPYDRGHMIMAKRMQYHLMKCRKNHPGKEFSVCPFNARHEVPKPELRYHMANCPDRARVEPMILYEQSKKEGTYFKGNTDLPNYNHSDQVQSVENWDEEIPSAPRIGVPANHFNKLDRRTLVGMTNAEKKQYMELIRLPQEDRIHNPEDIDERVEEEEDEDSKLRMPHSKPQTYMGRSGPNQQPSSVYAYSLSMSGIGRGQQVGRGRGNAFETVGRGRAAGRGVLNLPGQSLTDRHITKPPLITNGHASPGLCPGMSPYSMYTQSNGIAATADQHHPEEMPQYPAQSAINIFQMGLGRGRGLTQAYCEQMKNKIGESPSFIVPSFPTDDDTSYKYKDSPVNSEVNSSDPEDVNGLSKQEISPKAASRRDQRRFEKKLRQIEMLEKKIAEGYKPTTEEEIKVENKKDIILALDDLQV